MLMPPLQRELNDLRAKYENAQENNMLLWKSEKEIEHLRTELQQKEVCIVFVASSIPANSIFHST